jgi:hypothetical protein
MARCGGAWIGMARSGDENQFGKEAQMDKLAYPQIYREALAWQRQSLAHWERLQTIAWLGEIEAYIADSINYCKELIAANEQRLIEAGEHL